MKLIDADELLKQNDMMLSIREPNYWCTNPDEENYPNYYIEVNDINFWADKNKVDAIPIMWIYKYINENYEKYTISSFYGIRNEFELRAKAKELYTDLINDWRKDNESDN